MPALVVPGLLVAAVFVHPARVAEQARIEGRVVEGAGRPVVGASVRRFDDATCASPAPTGCRRYSGQARTDARGRFVIAAAARVDWWHPPIDYLIPWVHCYSRLELESPGGAAHATAFGDPGLTARDNPAGACNGVTFRPTVAVPGAPATHRVP